MRKKTLTRLETGDDPSLTEGNVEGKAQQRKENTVSDAATELHLYQKLNYNLNDA